VKDISGDGEELLRFPTAYPSKVVGRRSETLRANINAIVREHVPDVDASQINERQSEQIVALANALQASKDVIMLI
jgi:putative lipoic acid-binding regulatory protein